MTKAGGTISDQSQRAFFGRRKGHPLRPRQAALFDTLLPRLALDLTQPAPADLRALFANARDAVRLEIGFGGAEHLIAQAKANPQCGFIGSDAFVNAIAKALVSIEADKLDNIRLHFGDASALLAWLPDGGLARIDLLYPDPWPKRRHWKRRFIQDETLKRLARILKCGVNYASPPTSPITRPTRWRACCARKILSGPPSAPMIGASLGKALLARATKRKPNAKDACRRILFFGRRNCHSRIRAKRVDPE